MRLDHKERTVLSYVHLQADLSLAQLAEKTGLKSHTVRYILDSLLTKKILQPCVVVNKRALGFHTLCSYFNFRSEYFEKKKEILKSLKDSELVSWLSPTVGDYDFGLALAVKSFDQVHAFYSEIGKKHGPFFTDRTFALDQAWYYFGKKYLLIPEIPLPLIAIDDSTLDISIDEVDEKILNLMLVNPLVSESHLCKELHMPSSTVNARIARMKKQKIIVGFIYTLDYAAANISAYRMIVDCGGSDPEILKKIIAYARVHPHIVSMNSCVGSYDVEMSIEYLDSHSIQGFLNHFKETFQSEIRKVKVLSRLGDIKSFIVSPLAF